MKKDFRQSMIWLHDWSGILVCWVLYFIFITGTLGYYDTEIDHWMQPELPMKRSQEALSEQELNRRFMLGIEFLQQQAPGAERWFIQAGNNPHNQDLKVFWRWPRGEGSRKSGKAILSPTNGQAINTRATGGGQSLYRMHFVLHYMSSGIGFKIIAACTLLMFLSLITGIVAHRKIFKEFFTFRPDKGKSAWLDFHKLSSVASLPFQLMITYSGLIFAANTLMPLLGPGSYGFDAQTARAEAQALRQGVQIEAAGNPVSFAASDISPIIQDASQRWGSEAIRQIEIKHPGDQNSRVILSRHKLAPSDQGSSLVYRSSDAELLNPDARPPIGAMVARNTFINLHEGLFASPALRFLYFVFGLLGAAMVATGAIYWSQKRQRQNQGAKRGHKLVEHLNVGTIAGLPIAIAGYFIANRLLPLELANRAEWEMHCLFISWGACFTLALVRGTQQAWLDLTLMAAAMFTLVPIVNALTSQAHIVNSFQAGDWTRFGIDSAFICLAITATATLVLLKREPKTKLKTKPAPSP